MTELVRRILWLIPVLIAGALVVFLALGTTTQVGSRLSRPLLYNPSPRSAQLEARDALALARKGDAGGSKQLGLLGGAALPVVFEELSQLSVSEQRAVAQALEPVAVRMQLRGNAGWSSASVNGTADRDEVDKALLFWERYRDEHALDLRPLATSRLVKRAAQRDSQLKDADLLAVDTYALPSLVRSVGRVSRTEDVSRVRRLARAISHATGQHFLVGDDASIEDARIVATNIRSYWDANGAKWTQLGRSELLVARLSQTEFAAWVFRSVRQLTGLDYPELWKKFARRGRVSASLAAFCLVGLLVVGPIVAATIQVLSLRRSRWRLERWGLRTGLAVCLMMLVPLLAGPGSGNLFRLSLLSLMMGTAFSAFVLQRELNDRMDWRTHHVLRGRPGLARIGAIFGWLAPSVPTLTPIAVAEAALWVTCLEASSGTAGLGQGALAAYAEGDLDFLVAFCLSLGLVTGVAQILADMLLGSDRNPQGEM